LWLFSSNETTYRIYIPYYSYSLTPSVPNYKQKKLIFFVPNYKQKRPTFIIFNYVFSKNYLFQRKIKCKVHSICSIFHFLYNQLPIKLFLHLPIKLISKITQKNYVSNYYDLVFLINVVFFFVYNIGRRSIYITPSLKYHTLQFKQTVKSN